MSDEKAASFGSQICEVWGKFLLHIKFPIRFEDKGVWFLFWSVIFPTITFNIGFLFQNALNWQWGLGEYIQNNSQFYIKMTSGQSDQVTGIDIAIYSALSLFTTTGMLGTLTLWTGYLSCIWSIHAPLKYIWKPFLIIFIVICIAGTYISHFIVLSINPNVWMNYNVSQQYVFDQIEDNGMYKALGFMYNNTPWWYDPYWSYLNVVQGIIYGIAQPLLFYNYLIRNNENDELIQQWYGFYDFYSKFGFCALYGIAIFIAQMVGIQGFTPAFFFVFLWYKGCSCCTCCKSETDEQHFTHSLKYRGVLPTSPVHRGLLPTDHIKLQIADSIEQGASIQPGDDDDDDKSDDDFDLQDALTKLMSSIGDHFVDTNEEESFLNKLIDFISPDEERCWLCYDIIMGLAEEMCGIKEDDDLPFGLHVGDTKTHRLPEDSKRITGGTLKTLIQKITNLQQQRQKIKPVGTGYAWTNILGTDRENGVFVETMLTDDVKESELNHMNVLEHIHEHKSVHNDEMNTMNDVLDYDGYKQLLLPEWRKKYDEDYLVCAGSGCTYYKLNQHTWPLNAATPRDWKYNGNLNALQRQTITNPETGKPYKMLPNQPGYQGLSIGGTINVGVQGTGTQKTPQILKQHVNGKPVYKPDRSQAPGDFIRSLKMLVIINDKVEKWQIEPASNPVHDATKWKETFGDNFKLVQDDDIFYGSIISLGTIGIHVAYLFELIDASFEEEHRYIVPWDEFKSDHLPQIEKEVETGDIIRWQLWLSPYKTPLKWIPSKFSDSPPVVVSVYRKTDKIPERVLDSENAGAPRNGLSKSIIAAAAATCVSQTCPNLTPFILEMVLRESVARNKNEHKIVVDPFAAVALGPAVIVPSAAVGNAVDYKYLVESIEAWHKFGQQSFPECPIVVPTAARFSCQSNQLLSLANHGPTVWFESVSLDWTKSEWPYLGVVPNGDKHLYGVNKLFHDSKKFKARYNWGLDFDVKTEKANIWRNQQEQITEFVEKVYKKMSYKNGPFVNEFVTDTGIEEMAYGGKKIEELIDDETSDDPASDEQTAERVSIKCCWKRGKKGSLP